MKLLIVCVSMRHGNTKKVADAMAAVLQADVVAPGDGPPTRPLAMTSSGLARGSTLKNTKAFARIC